MLPKKFGSFDVADDGRLRLNAPGYFHHSADTFAIYDASGKPTGKYVGYWLRDGEIESRTIERQ